MSTYTIHRIPMPAPRDPDLSDIGQELETVDAVGVTEAVRRWHLAGIAVAAVDPETMRVAFYHDTPRVIPRSREAWHTGPVVCPADAAARLKAMWERRAAA